MGNDQAITFDHMWRQAVASHGDRPFLTFEAAATVRRWTYAEFDAVVDAACVRLIGAGVEPGSAVHLALTNSPTFVAVWLAAIRLGAWIVPSDPQATSAELAEHLARTRPAVGFCAATRAQTYHAAGAELAPATVIEVNEADTELRWVAAPEACPGVDTAGAAPGGRDRAALMFTSGTTGRPKGVEVTQANYAFAGTTMAAACRLTADDVQLVVLPLFHANAQYYSFAAAIAAGASVALMPTFSASGFLSQAARHGATCASLFAGPMRMILARATPLPDGPPPRLRHCWFAQNLTAAQYEQFAALTGVRPRQLYGMTETIPAVLTDSADDPRPDTMGYVTPGCAVELADVGPDGEGELIVGGEPGITLFAGYLDDPATTAASYDPPGSDQPDHRPADAGRTRWFRTGDRATRDADGRFRFTGRRCDVLKVAGENVSTVEVEQALAEHPGVADVAVVGAPDPIRDEVPVAIVVAAPGHDEPNLRAELERWSVDRLAKAKRPAKIRFVTELPRTSVGKIKKYQLRDTGAQHPGGQP